MIRARSVTGVAFGEAADGNPRIDDEARRRVAADLGIASEWAWVRQVHGAVVSVPSSTGVGEEGDGLVTQLPGFPLAVSIADCFPVAIVGAGGVGIAHAGWRGADAGIVAAVRDELAGRGAAPSAAVIGPGIGPCCFEVGPEVAARFPEDLAETSWGTVSVDLRSVIGRQLAGLEVEIVDGCTHHEQRFHSFRRNGTGERQFGVTWLPPV